MRPLALLLTVLTGATGLVYEVAWQKYLATMLGSQSEATAAVLGIFLAGLSVGYAVFGAVSRALVTRGERRGEPPALLRVYGAVEAGIGLYAVLFPALFDAVLRISLALPGEPPALSFGLDVGLTALLLLPPTILMGGTIPLLTQALSHGLEDATRFHAFVYGFNTAGAFFGALAAGFALVPWLGLPAVLHAMGAVNMAVGATFAVLGWRTRGAAPVPATTGAERPRGYAAFVLAAVLLGFAMMVVQTVMNRIGGLALGSSPYTFAMVTALFVLCIAAGSLVVSALRRIPRWLLLADLGLLFAWLLGCYALLGSSPFLAYLLRVAFSRNAVGFYAFYGAALGAMLLTIGPAIVLSGAALPLLFHVLRSEARELGNLAGSLYSWNTLGSLLGALLGGYLLLHWIDLHAVYRIGVGAVALAAGLVAIGAFPGGVARAVAGVAVPAALVALVLPAAWDPRMLAGGFFRSRQLIPMRAYTPEEALVGREPPIFYEDGPVASVAVENDRDAEGRPIRAIINNGKPDGSTGPDYPTMALAALMPAVLCDRVERAFVVGFGTGITSGELAALDDTQRVVVAEISGAVLRAASAFAEVSPLPYDSPKIVTLRSDAYRALRRSEERYDAIVSEPSNPWVAGVEMLYSREFLQAARARLRPGGVFVQWYHQYETDAATVEMVLRTYASVFGSVAVWHGAGPDLLILGFPEADRRLDLAAVEERAARSDVAAGLRRAGIRAPDALLAHELLPVGVVGALRLHGPLHTLFHPRLAHVAGRAFFAGHTGALPFSGGGEVARTGAEHSLLRRALEREGFSGDAFAAVAREACRHRADTCGALLADWLVHHPDSRRAARALQRLADGRRLFGGPLLAEGVRELADLLADRFHEGRPFPPAVGERANGLYASFYSHAVAFDPTALVSLWSRCRAPAGDPGACSRGAQQARLLAGARDPQRASALGARR